MSIACTGSFAPEDLQARTHPPGVAPAQLIVMHADLLKHFAPALQPSAASRQQLKPDAPLQQPCMSGSISFHNDHAPSIAYCDLHVLVQQNEVPGSLSSLRKLYCGHSIVPLQPAHACRYEYRCTSTKDLMWNARGLSRAVNFQQASRCRLSTKLIISSAKKSSLRM